MQKNKLEYFKTIGIVNNGDNGRGFANPNDLAVASDGRIFVLNRVEPLILAARPAALRVGICNLDEDYLGEFGYGYGSADGQLMLPTCITFDNNELIHITDEHLNRVSVFDLEGNFLRKWGQGGNREAEFDGLSGIAFDSQNNAYVTDQHNHRIQKFDGEGSYIKQWGQHGTDEGQLNMPWGLTVDTDDNVYVADWRNDRIQKFTSEGDFVTSFGKSGQEEGQFNRPSSIAVDHDGNMYVADWGNERVQVLESGGGFVQSIRGEATLSKWAEDFFASNPDEMSGRELSNLMPHLPSHLADPYHESSQTESYFWGPASVSLDNSNQLYITETNRHRFQVYRFASS